MANATAIPRPWWQASVVYQIYPRSFADTDGDGIGDLEGIRRRLDYVAALGVDAIWLSPIFSSPMADFGYDVADYCDVAPMFGTLAAFDHLLAEAHQRGLRVLLDFVPNHTSDRHPWFLDARASRTSPRRDWYVWRDPAPGGGPPNNWIAAFGTAVPAWTFDALTGQYYLHSFLPGQPELNWGNPAVVQAMHDVVRFWLDRGVDGFRIDVVHSLGKDPTLPDDPPHLAGLPHACLNDHPSTHDLLRGLRRLVETYPGDRVLIGEVFLLLTTTHATYARPDELHLVFDLPAAVTTPWEAPAWRERVRDVAARCTDAQAWPTWVLSNHDVSRHRSRFGSEARARAAAVLNLTLRGTPFVYAGEELGLEDAVIPPERRLDPGGRDGCRAPLPWTATPDHGWTEAPPWLPWPADATARNVATLETTPTSILHLYRRLLSLRRRMPVLQVGSLTLRSSPDDVVAYDRRDATSDVTVLVNFSRREVACEAVGQVLISSDGEDEGRPYRGVLRPDQAVVLTPDRNTLAAPAAPGR